MQMISEKGLNVDQVFLEREAARLFIYRFLNTLYTYPSKSCLDCIDEMNASGIIMDAAGSLGLIENGGFCDLFNGLVSEDLEVEYTRLFINSFHGTPVKPYASCYLDKQKRVMGDSSLWVIDFYHTYGVDCSESHKEPPDHIAVEMEFIAHLIETGLTAYKAQDIERGDQLYEAQKRFLMGHFLRWAGKFFDLVCIHARVPFFLESGRFSKAFFEFEDACFNKRHKEDEGIRK